MPRHLLADEDQELAHQQQPAVGVGAGIEPEQGLVERRHHGGVRLVAAQRGLQPGVVVDDVDVAAGPALALAVDEADLGEVAHRAGDRRRAHAERLDQLGGGHPAVLVDRQRGEHPGGEPLQPGVGQGGAHPLDVALAGVGHESEYRSIQKLLKEAYAGGMAEPIEIAGLVKRFGATTALDGLDLTVTRGEVHGFLGPNGAGKSTTIRVLLGLLRTDAGDGTAARRRPVARRGRSCTGGWRTSPAT